MAYSETTGQRTDIGVVWHNGRLCLEAHSPEAKQVLMSLWAMCGSQILNLDHSVDAGPRIEGNDQDSVIAVEMGR